MFDVDASLDDADRAGSCDTVTVVPLALLRIRPSLVGRPLPCAAIFDCDNFGREGFAEMISLLPSNVDLLQVTSGANVHPNGN